MSKRIWGITVMKKGMTGWQNWMESYPNYIYLFDGKVLKAPAKYGISMNEVYETVKEKVFPTTVANSAMQIEDLRHYHYRRDKVRITNACEEYLDNKLEKLFEEYGYETL